MKELKETKKSFSWYNIHQNSKILINSIAFLDIYLLLGQIVT